MNVIWRYERFIYRRLWEAGKYGSLGESRFQMVPWLGITIALIAVSSFINLEPNSYPMFALAILVFSPVAMGVLLIYRVMWRVARRRTALEPVLFDHHG